MILLAGTSGFSFDEWRGSFYPAELAKSEMLAHYARRLPSVEINNTFYQMPKAAVLEQWAAVTPTEFRFSLKASRRITHIGRLRNVGDAVAHLLKVSAALEEKLGALLFQLPPNLRRDDVLLEEFLSLLPSGCCAALEFRHASWFDDAVFELLRRRGVALVGGDEADTGRALPLVPTAEHGYLRLRAPSYDRAALGVWRDRIAAMSWQRAFVFFKHEALGPAYALELLGLPRAAAGPTLAKGALDEARSGRPPRPGVAAAGPRDASKPRGKRRKA